MIRAFPWLRSEERRIPVHCIDMASGMSWFRKAGLQARARNAGPIGIGHEYILTVSQTDILSRLVIRCALEDP